MPSRFNGRKINPPDGPRSSVKRQPPATQEQKEEAYEMRKRGLSWRAIGRKMGYTDSSVRTWIVAEWGDPMPKGYLNG